MDPCIPPAYRYPEPVNVKTMRKNSGWLLKYTMMREMAVRGKYPGHTGQVVYEIKKG
jgi:hypothetical protein